MSDRDLVSSTYHDLLRAWNQRKAEGFAANFADEGDRWLIAHYQNTPAQFHGRPELVKSLTDELRKARASNK